MSKLPTIPPPALQAWRFLVTFGSAAPVEMTAIATTAAAAEKQLVAAIVAGGQWHRGFGLQLHPSHRSNK